MRMYKIGLKRIFSLFNADLKLFIPVFHEWIQKSSISKHVMVDVADYKHMIDGPGVMLISHEGNFSVDLQDGEVGFMYIRKQPLKNDILENIKEVKSILNAGCDQLITNSILKEKIGFTNEYHLVSNDRYHFTNDKKSKDALVSYAQKAFTSNDITAVETYPGERLKIKINNEV